ncbi:hypothetical protein [Glycomyces tarimensis]
MDADFTDDIANAFPTGLYPEEWSETLKPDLEAAAEQAETEQVMAAAKAARAKARARFTTPTPQRKTEPEPASAPTPEPGQGQRREYETSTPLTEAKRSHDLVSAAPTPDYGPPPVLTRPLRNAVAGKAPHRSPARNRQRLRAHSHAQTPKPAHQPPGSRHPAPGTQLPGPRSRLQVNANPTRPGTALHGTTGYLRAARPPQPSRHLLLSLPIVQGDHHARPFPPTPPRPLPDSAGPPAGAHHGQLRLTTPAVQPPLHRCLGAGWPDVAHTS